jgi:dTDP-4-amino-4,6-dideoxygalactose transaminase
MEIRDTMLPVLRPLGGEEEVQAIREVIESGWWGKVLKLQSSNRSLLRWLVLNMQ